MAPSYCLSYDGNKSVEGSDGHFIYPHDWLKRYRRRKAIRHNLKVYQLVHLDKLRWDNRTSKWHLHRLEENAKYYSEV